MKKQTTEPTAESRVTWEHLEAWVRNKMRKWLQELLDAEVDDLLGRRKSERRPAVDSAPGYRSGYGKPRRLTLSNGTVTLRRPRVRGLAQRFASRLMPLFARRTPEVSALLPELYLHGLALGDFDLALRGLLGDDAPLSTTTVARLKERWHAEYAQWASRPLADLQVVYLWVDGVYVKAGLEKEKAAVLVVLAALRDGRKELVAVVPGHRESTESWSDVLRDLKARGLTTPKLVVGDGHLGIWAGLRNVYPDAQEQRCWNHKILNALDKVPKTRQAEARRLLTEIPYAPTQQDAEQRKAGYQRWCRQQGLEAAAAVLDRDWDRMLTFYSFPREHWVHLRTSNPIESPFAALRLRTDAARRFKKVDNATAVIWKMLLVAQQRFQRLHASELLTEVYHGAAFVDGVRVMEQEWRVAA
ncbi:IS256 family transposase [Patescibacteria group bacterium]|nr:MAG: IS256 family transposase [Patescibacteria group bacterium]